MTKRKAPKDHKRRGRRIEYPEKLFLSILERYAQGENLLEILKGEGMPNWGTFWKRVMGPNAAPDLVAAHARARESWAEAKVVEAMDITDRPQLGKKVRLNGKGKVESVTRGDMVDARRLRVNTRLWFAERVLSKSYGAAMRHQNPDGSPLNVVPVLHVTMVAAEKK